MKALVPRHQRSLFQEPPVDPIWHSEQLRTMAAEGFYWTPWGLHNGLVAPRPPEAERPEPGRARARSQPAKKVIA